MSEIISGVLEKEIKPIDYRSNEGKYKEVFANGRKNRWWNKYSDTEYAYKSRDILIKIATKERELLKNGTLKSIGDSVAIYPIMLSRAAGGLLSGKPMPEYNGESPRDFVLHTLEKYYQKEYQNEK